MLVERLPVASQNRVLVMHPLDRAGKHLDAPYPYLSETARDSQLFRGVAGVDHLGSRPVPFMDGTTPIAA